MKRYFVMWAELDDRAEYGIASAHARAFTNRNSASKWAKGVSGAFSLSVALWMGSMLIGKWKNGKKVRP